MIAHRTSVFDENLPAKLDRNGLDTSLEPGHRATWSDRAWLVVAKLGNRCDEVCDLGALILHNGPDRAQDDLIEAHILGRWTIRSVDEVVVQKGHIDRATVAALDLRAKKDATFSWRYAS